MCGVILGLILAVCVVLTHAWPAVGGDESVVEVDYEGLVLLPNSENFMTGMKITEEKCFVRIREQGPGLLSVESSFSKDPVIVRAINRSGQFYTGRFGDNQALVLQLNPSRDVVALTHTTFDKQGRLNYGAKGNGEFTRECLIPHT